MDAKPTAERLTSHAALGSINWRTNQSLQRAVQLCLARIGQRRTVHASIHCRRRGEVRRVSSVWCQPIFGDSSHADIRHTPISCQPIFVTRDIRTRQREHGRDGCGSRYPRGHARRPAPRHRTHAAGADGGGTQPASTAAGAARPRIRPRPMESRNGNAPARRARASAARGTVRTVPRRASTRVTS